MKIKSVNIPDFEDFAENDLYDQLLNKLLSAFKRIEKYKGYATIEKRCNENNSPTYGIQVSFRNTDFRDLRDTEISISLVTQVYNVFEMNYRKAILNSGAFSTNPGIRFEERITFVGDKEKDKLYLDRFEEIFKQISSIGAL